MKENKSVLSRNPNLRTYISVGCNKTSNCIDWSYNGLLCYGAANSVAVCEFSEGVPQVVLTLNKHKGRVNCVKWVRGYCKVADLISASSDNSLIVWRLCDGDIKPTSIMTSHSQPVTIVDGVYSSEVGESGYADTFIASTSADSTVKLWLRKHFEEEFTCVYTVNLGSGVCLSLCLTVVSKSGGILLALGTDDCRVHLHSDEAKLQTLEGHEDWVKSLDFISTSCGDVLLCSGSQDTTIRLWKISRRSDEKTGKDEFRLPDQAFTLGGIEFLVTLESLLMGHEGWVSSVRWKHDSDGRQLVSCSLDRTVLLWQVDKETGVWLETSRLGELGGNTLGYLTVVFSPDAKMLVANSHQGAIHMWTLQDGGCWRSVGFPGGHFEGVVDVDWERSYGRYLLSCSLDKTTRLFAPWNRSASKDCWFEMSRPQVHGHSMAGLAALPDFSLASASEEKVVRVFTAPDNVLHNLANLSDSFSQCERKEGEGALGAAVPSLGLSNKAVFQSEDQVTSDRSHPKDEFSEAYFTPQNLSEPPTEDNLVQNTLWPEVMKLYGHGYEVYSLAATWAGDLLATACKASSPLHAKILLWETESWDQVGELEGHNLTVTQMEFSPDDRKLLSVSRDRTWCLFLRTDETKEFKLLLRSVKQFNPHSRIIWCCGWSYEGLYFATGSRDCKVAVWPGESLHILAARPPAGVPLTLQHPVMALAFSRTNIPCLPPLRYLLAVALETGSIHAYLWEPTSWTFLLTIPSTIGHHGSVSRLRFRPTLGRAEANKEETRDESVVQLASCALDHSVRIYTINLNHYVSNLPKT